MANVESMFYQFRVLKEDSEFLQFLWWPGGDIEKELEEKRDGPAHIWSYILSKLC